MKISILTILILLSSFLSFSQDETVEKDSMVVVTMTNGDVRIGTIKSDDGREILFISKDIGQIYIRKENINSIVPFEENEYELIDGEYRNAGPFTTRYYFTTNALAIKKGENYALVNLYGPEVHFALTDRLSLGAMTTWIASPFVLAAKYTVPTNNKNVNFGLGTLIGTSGYLNQFRGFGGLHWGMLTFGDRMKNITLSAGFSYINLGFEQNIFSNDPNYLVGTYPAVEAEYNAGYYNFEYIPSNPSKSNTSTAPTFGIAGITKVGKTASFFFDSMVFFGKTKQTSRQDFYDPISGQPSYTVVSDDDDAQIVAFFMPGMRFQKSEKTAFQFAAAGVISVKNGESSAFPIPMCSWFFKF